MAAPSLSSKDTIAVVTGANRGIGFEIVRMLAEQGPTVVLTARDEKRGQAAVDALLKKGLKNVVFHQLDAIDSKSVQKLAAWLKSEYGGLDILINNAAYQGKNYDYETAKDTIETNYFGVKSVTATLLPLMKSSPHGARIINFSTRMALYDRLSAGEAKKTFEDEEAYTEEVADSLAKKYLGDMKDGTAEKEGWIPNVDGKGPMYSESKMVLNVYSVALANSLEKSQPEGHQIFVASTCPGVTKTDMLIEAMNKGYKPPEGFPLKSPEEGADTAVWLALLPEAEWKGKNGKFFAERSEYLFGWKNPGY